jgi:C-terminal processing protease CtpA/Prc
MDMLYRDFYGELPESDNATYAAIRGVLSQVEDPNTSFMSPDEADFFRSRTCRAASRASARASIGT